MADLLALADRVEKETAGSRELDAEIAAAVRYHPYGPNHWIGGADIEIRATGHCVQAFRATGESCDNWKPPSYTSSLDAAMSLAGNFTVPVLLAALSLASSYFVEFSDKNYHIRNTLPRFIAAAALRARANNGSAT